MSKVKKLITTIRDTLNDPEGDRWNNDRLIRAINEAILDINLKARVGRSKSIFNLTGGVHTYRLDTTIQILTRCTANGVAIPFKSHAEMDAISETWESDTGESLQYIIYDKLNRGEIRVYPTPPSSVEDIVPEFGIITDVDGIDFDSVYGIITDFEDRNNIDSKVEEAQNDIEEELKQDAKMAEDKSKDEEDKPKEED